MEIMLDEIGSYTCNPTQQQHHQTFYQRIS